MGWVLDLNFQSGERNSYHLYHPLKIHVLKYRIPFRKLKFLFSRIQPFYETRSDKRES